MGSSAPPQPTPPNPVATATAQGEANLQTAIGQTAMNNTNQYTPYGSMTYQQTGTQTITNPDGTTSNVPTYTSTQTLSAPEQRLFNQQNALAGQENTIAGTAMNTLQDNFNNPITDAGLPALTTDLGSTPTLANGYGSGGQVQSGYDSGGAIASGYGSGGSIQSGLGLNASTPGGFGASGPIQQSLGTDFSGERDAATNAALARLQPSMDRSNAELQSQLANQGVAAGSSAYTGAVQQQAQGNNDLQLGAVQTGDAEQQALFNEGATAGQFANSAQQQGFDQAQSRGLFGMQATAQNNAALTTEGQFGNSAQAQSNSQNAQAAAFQDAAQGQQNSQNAQAAAFGNAAQAQRNTQNQQAAAFHNTAAEQDFQNTQAAATFGNQAREQSLSDQESIQNNAVNQISALMHGGQATSGTYQGYSPGTIGQTPLSQDTYASAGLAEQNYMTQMQSAAANNTAMMQGLTGLFGMGGNYLAGRNIMPSDRRLKRDVRVLGKAPNGLPLYAFRYIWDEKRSPFTLGHMADEVAAVHPGAVHRHPSGFDMVDYGALEG